ncbi:hypothetical protein AMJ71_05835 [candidate division TA06 bacterium SM1_40]|uniref:Uncharacterized protein n=1 Tax=candidate division TA06 bacterium SM1_40 TaxID=1703773 RepID=A0A0S8JIS3_UNCT6|nr:MAG: hypothetical protein AMJ71_05835 [candidate division TA06 bacterium SM1_40]
MWRRSSIQQLTIQGAAFLMGCPLRLVGDTAHDCTLWKTDFGVALSRFPKKVLIGLLSDLSI